MSGPDLDGLAAALSARALLRGPDTFAGYRRDRSDAPDAGFPAAVVRVQSTDDVRATLRFATQHGLPVVTRGAGTGLSGGATAVDGCIVLSTERLSAVVVDPGTRTCRAGAGALTADVKASAAALGLWYPPDPASFDISTIGGNAATNAGGLCCVKYGVTGDYVLGMTVVLADGDVVQLGGPRLKDVAGLPLTELFVGSEGTLGVITELVLRLLPARAAPATAVASFGSVAAATGAVLEIGQRIRPAMLELMNGSAIGAVEDAARMGLDRDAAALLVVQSDEPGAAEAELTVVTAICEAHGATEVHATTDAQEAEEFVHARRTALPAVERRGSVLLEDVCVPLPALGDLVTGVAEIADRYRVDIPLVAHAGDGNTHPFIVHDAADADERARAAEAFDAVMMLAIDLGGTITGEHGVGRLKAPWLGASIGSPTLDLNRRVKNALDPLGILNPGCMF